MSAVSALLDWAYQRAVHGASGLESAVELAEDYLNAPGSLDERASSLVRRQMLKAGSTGFLSGLGGIVSLPVSLPAGMAAAALIQTRMIAAIAHMGGHDLQSDTVKTMVLLCLTGNAALDLVKKKAIPAGTGYAARLLGHAGNSALPRLLGRSMPVFGGVLCGACDAGATWAMGERARKMFLPEVIEAEPPAV